MSCSSRVACLIASAIPLVMHPASAQSPPSATDGKDTACELQAGDSHAVVAVLDAETIQLDDGSEVRLAGALAPSPPAFLGPDAEWRPQVQARAALTELLSGHQVELAYGDGPRVDRWGRKLAHVFRIEKGEREWVQGFMLRHGHARVDAVPDLTCLHELRAHEREAMTADRGLWTNPAYRIRWADAPQRLMRLRNSFQLIEGRVRKVAVTRGRIYVNFGDDWRIDFTAGASRRAPNFSAQALATLQALEGKRVRLRGWIERRNGPYIELHHPLQIEALDDEALPPSTGLARGTVPPDAAANDDGRHQADIAPGDPSPGSEKQERPERGVPGALDL